MHYAFMCKKNVMEPTVFMGCFERGIVVWSNEDTAFLLGFGRVMKYPLNCQKIWYRAQTILGAPRMGYCMFIEYFALWTWVQHTLNACKLN
jgi:hypothetical protein